MAIVKLDALTNFAAAIATAIPALAGKITIQQAPSAQVKTFPNLALVVAGKMTFDPAQRLISQDLGGNVLVWNVGCHEGMLQLQLTCSTTLDRATIEQELIDLLLSRIGGPGVFVVPVVSSSVIDWVAAFEYEDATWMDQRALEREYESVISVNFIVPALLIESPVYDINTLVLGFTEDFTTTPTADNFGPPLDELVSINQDGTIVPFTP